MWYYIEVHHGGGHQSTTSKWVYREKSVPIKTSADIENFCDGEFDGTYFGGDSAIFHVKAVRKLPAQEHAGLIKSYQASITHAEKMLAVLHNTETHPPRCPKRPNEMFQCVREANHKGKCDVSKRHNREKFGRY